MSVAHLTRNEAIIEALLDDEESEDFDSAKEVSGVPEELLASQKAELLPKIIASKEAYLGKSCVRTMEHTNPNHETFIYGKFGHRNGTLATLLYLDPKQGWVPADTTQRIGEDEEEFDDEDFKEVYGGEERKKYLPLGSISWGTMREDHLIPKFIHALRYVDPARAQALEAEANELEDEDDKSYFCWEDLFNALEEHAPPYTYFGSHEGDGADYGVWVSHESIDEALESEELRPMRKGEAFIPGETDVVLLDDSGDYLALLDGQTGRTIWEI